MQNIFQWLWHLPGKTAGLLIKYYQKTLSPDHGWLKGFFPHGYCKFEPTCSQYTVEAIGKYGFMRGLLKGALRILRCNPCSKGGIERA